MNNKIALVLIIILLIISFYRSNVGFYDQDEYTHAVTLKNVSGKVFFDPWNRGGFKAFYLPVSFLSLEYLRLVNLFLLTGVCWLLYKISDSFTMLILLTMPLISLMGCRFYSEILAMVLLTTSFYLYKKEKWWLFTLVVSYLPLIRAELVLLYIPAAVVLFRHNKLREIWLLCVFPLAFYAISIVYYNSFTKLFNVYFGFVGGTGHQNQYQWHMKGGYDHYLKEMITLAGIWALFAFPEWLKSLKKGSFIAVSGMMILLFYVFSFWDRTGFSSNVGNSRHILTLAPVIAYYSDKMMRTLSARIPLFVIALTFMLLVPNYTKSGELLAIEELRNKTSINGKVFVEHTYLNYLLNIQIRDNRITDIGRAKRGDIVVWDNHYAARKVPLNYFGEVRDNVLSLMGWRMVDMEHYKSFTVIAVVKE